MNILPHVVLLAAAVGICIAHCQKHDHHYSCKDLKHFHPSFGNGEYEFTYGHGQNYTAYCEFHDTYGYQFLLKEEKSSVHTALHLLNASKKQVLVRHARSDGKQYDTLMEQLSSYSSTPLSIQYNQNSGYATPLNHQTWGPYLYLGFLPTDLANKRSVQGYRANGQDYTFTNCDSNPNSYLAFFINKNHGDPTDYHTRCCYTPLMRNWINVGLPAASKLPCDYFFQFEMHMGGCGGYAINGYSTLQDITGAALGMRFELK